MFGILAERMWLSIRGGTGTGLSPKRGIEGECPPRDWRSLLCVAAEVESFLNRLAARRLIEISGRRSMNCFRRHDRTPRHVQTVCARPSPTRTKRHLPDGMICANSSRNHLRLAITNRRVVAIVCIAGRYFPVLSLFSRKIIPGLPRPIGGASALRPSAVCLPHITCR